MSVVKQERHDEAEIEAMADKIREGNKNRMVQQGKAQAGAGQAVSLIPLTNDKRKPGAPPHADGNGKSAAPIDDDSLRGRFGWESIGKALIPYINRAGERYCAVKMVEMKALNKYLTYLHQDIYNCTCIRSYYITEAECRLLNEINIKHSESQFGREQFTQRDLIVRLSDAIEFFNFLSSCYTKLITGDTDPLSRSGFIRINKESVVPYTVYSEQKYVPLFYFEGETENLKQRANKLEGWDLSYLKFCCKVQGIRNELFAHDSCSVISLNDIKNYFPPGTLFEDYWPTKSVDSQLLVSASTRNQSQIIQWTRQPTQPPVPHAAQKPAGLQPKPTTPINNMHNIHSYTSFGGIAPATPHAYHPAQQTHPANAIVRNTYQPQAANRHMRSPNCYSNITQGPPPLVPTTKSTTQTPSNFHYTTSQANLTNYMLASEQMNNQPHYHQENNDDQPPPMIPIRQFLANGGVLTPSYLRQQQAQRLQHMELANSNSTSPRDMQNNYSVNNRQSLLINQQPAHQQSTRTVQSNVFDDQQQHGSMSNGQMCLDDLSCKLIPIPELSSGSQHIPYKMQKALVEGKLLPCINMKPHVCAKLLVTIPDLIINFFNNIPVQACQRVMSVLNIDMYKPNNSQTHVLMEAGKCQTPNEIIPLVQVRDVIDYMPQLKYMLGGVLPHMSNKRQRSS